MIDLTASEQLRASMIKGFFLKILSFCMLILILDASASIALTRVNQLMFDLIYMGLLITSYFFLEVKKNTDLAVSIALFGIAIIQPLYVYQSGGLFTIQSIWLPSFYLIVRSTSIGEYQNLSSKLLVGGFFLAISASYFFNPNNVDFFEFSALEFGISIFLQCLLCWGINRCETKFSDEINSRVKLEERQEVLKAAIVTYNHEIRNPLAIAKGYIEVAGKKEKDLKELESISEALDRVEAVLNSIEKVKIHSIEYETYDGSLQMLKIKK